MKPCPDSSVDNLVAEVVNPVEVPYRIQVPGRPGGLEPGDIKVGVVGAGEGGEPLRHSRRNRTVCARVFGVVGRSRERPTAGLFASYRAGLELARNAAKQT